MSDPRGVTVTEIRYMALGEAERFYPDAEILELFPDGDGSLVNRLLHRAQAAETKVERLQAIVDKLPKCWRLADDGTLVQDQPIVPGMVLYYTDFLSRTICTTEPVREDLSFCWCNCDDKGRCRWTSYRDCYDTRVAAEAAGR